MIIQNPTILEPGITTVSNPAVSTVGTVTANYTPILMLGGLCIVAVIVIAFALRKTLKIKYWNFFKIPYYYWRIVDNNFQVIFSHTERDTGQKAVINESAGFAGIIPTDRPILIDGSCKELLYSHNDARPITILDTQTYPELSKLIPKDRKFIFFKTPSKKAIKTDANGDKIYQEVLDKDGNKQLKPVYEIQAKIADTVLITKDIPVRWLKKTLETKFVSEIQETPPEKFGWIREVAIMAIVGIIVLGGIFILMKAMGAI